jgi:hypothetical protein
MKSELLNGTSPLVNRPVTICGRGINHRNLTTDERVALATGLRTGAVQVTGLSLQQACDVVHGAARSRVRRATKAARRNEAARRNGNGAVSPSPAAMAAGLVDAVGVDTAVDLLIEADRNNR